MTDFFKNALGMFGTGGVKEDNEFVGQLVEVGSQRLRIKKVIAEGGFAFVYVAQDVSSGKDYALKRLLASDSEKDKAIVQEIRFLKRLSGHPNILQFVSAASIGQSESGHGQTEYLLLTELCPSGIVELYNKRGRPLPPNKVLQMFYQVCKAVQHMHDRQPPIIHRDMKMENLLLAADGTVKLCDFGSATTKCYYPDETWSVNQRGLVEEEIAKHTTPMYRTPEMLDLYQNFPISEPQDVWALGCVLYQLCFMTHPFEDSAKLRIINAKYTIPEFDREYAIFHQLIQQAFQIDPRERPVIDEVLSQLEEIAAARGVSLTSADVLHSSDDGVSAERSTHAPQGQPQVTEHQQREAIHEQSAVNSVNTAGSAGGGFLSSLKGGAGSLMKNIKDASSKVAHTISQTASYMGNKEMDVAFITRRIMVMPFPSDMHELGPHNLLEDVRGYLDSQHRDHYYVYNVTQRTYDVRKFSQRVYNCPCPSKSKIPPLDALFALCMNMYSWLAKNSDNICVIHCEDGRTLSTSVAAALLAFSKSLQSSRQIMNLCVERRLNRHVQAREMTLDPSQIRYIDYIKNISNGTVPHRRAIQLLSITLSPVPLFNKMRTGCRPLLEVKCGSQLLLSTSAEYEKMREYTVADGTVKVPFSPTIIFGDVCITVSHARSSLGTKLQGKLSSVRILQLRLHTGFIPREKTTLMFTRGDLDLDPEAADKLPDLFKLTLTLKVSNDERPAREKISWANWNPSTTNPLTPFSGKTEYEQTLQLYGEGDDNSNQNTASRRPPSRPPPPVPSNGTSQQKDAISHAQYREHTERLVSSSESESESDEDISPPAASPQEPVDLLNLGGITSTPEPVKQPATSGTFFDLIGDNAHVPPANQHSATLSDLSTPYAPTTQPINNGPVDLLGGFESADVSQSNGLLKPQVDLPVSHASSSNSLVDQDFMNLMGDFNQRPSSGLASSTDNILGGTDSPTPPSTAFNPLHANAGMPRNYSAPNFHNSAFQQQPLNSRPGASATRPQSGLAASQNSTAGKPNQAPAAGGSSRPNYFGGTTAGVNSSAGSNSVFDSKAKPGYTGVGPKVDNNAFDDLLGNHKFTPKPSKPTTLKGMKNDVLAQEMDPNELRVRQWTEGKERNIRALLSSLHQILWDGEERWKPLGMHELVEPTQIKKWYRKACLTAHPDKQVNGPHETLARLIFVELNDAMAEFESQGSKALYG